jgi:XTP/dITP diphosphohydrolase
MALYDGGKFVGAVRGECKGKIAPSIRGANGFGYDPVFIPQGFTKTFAELPPAKKNQISHRSKALRAAVSMIKKYLKRTS